MTVIEIKHEKETFVVLTDSLLQPLWFALPPNTKEVDGYPGGDDAKANSTFTWSLPEGNDDEEEAGQHKTHRQQNIHLQGGDGKI